MTEETDPRVAALDASAARALGGRRFAEARQFLLQATEIAPEDPDLWIKIAATHRAEGGLKSAIGALEQGLTRSPRHFMALLMRANLLEKLGDPTADEAYGIAVGLAPPDDRLDPPTLAALQRARTRYAAYVAQRRAQLQQAAATTPASPDEAKRVARFIDDHLRLTKRYRQEPSHFYFPGLPDIEFYDRSLFPWLEAFEASSTDILEELRGVLDEGGEGFVPYVDYPDYLPVDQWKELNRNPDWGAFHLLKGGVRIAENADRCPRTMAAVAQLPQPDVKGRGPTAMFSALQPHTRIPPHTGVSNARLLAHLPLIIPDRCGFRVGNVTREWTFGEAFVFDDTLEHEAWNDSDEIRIILIVDIWAPGLSPAERDAIRAVVEATGDPNRTGASPGA